MQTVILIYVELSLVHVPTLEFHEFGTGRGLAILHQDGLMEVLPEEAELQLELCLPELVQVPTYGDRVHLYCPICNLLLDCQALVIIQNIPRMFFNREGVTDVLIEVIDVNIRVSAWDLVGFPRLEELRDLLKSIMFTSESANQCIRGSYGFCVLRRSYRGDVQRPHLILGQGL